MPRSTGYTLIETMMVLAVLAVAIAIGAPSFAGTLARHRVQTAMHLVGTDLAMARSSAIMRRSQVVVCPRTAELQCRSDADWSHGWMVFADANGNRAPDTAADLLRVTDPPSGSALALGATRPFIRYQRDGRSAGTNLTVRVCSRDSLKGEVVVNNLGRVRSARPTRPVACPL